MPKLSVIIPTYNEDKYLKGALHSVQFADEIIVVDSLSTDKTVEIAEQHGCKVVARAFDNFSNQKNYALEFANCEWVLFLDADERIPYQLQVEIKTAINQSEIKGFKLKFPHFFMNRFLFYQGSSVIRLVQRKKCRFEGSVHEKLIIDGKICQLKTSVLHYTYKGIEHYLKKKDSYAWFQAEQMLKKGKKTNYFHLAFKPFYRFFHSYIIKGGFKDGLPALAVAAANAYGVFSRYAKLMLLQKNLK